MQYTEHARQRCLKRGYSNQDIEHIIACGNVCAVKESVVNYRLGQHVVILCRKKNEVITVYKLKNMQPRRSLREFRKYKRKNGLE